MDWTNFFGFFLTLTLFFGSLWILTTLRDVLVRRWARR